jgi:predicted transposase YbfD/YdcC
MSDLSLLVHFAPLKDPRLNRTRRHKLLDIIGLATCGAICGLREWTAIEEYGKNNQTWLSTFLELPNGIPSHDTLGRVFARLNPKDFAACFAAWAAAVSSTLPLDHVSIDGKTLRGSGDSAAGQSPLHLVSAWATEHHLSLGQVAVHDKSNEITAIPELLRILDLKGALVTIDAMGCQKKIAQEIRDAGADYILQVKDNQPHLLEDIQACFESDEGCEEYTETTRGHGRTETRMVSILPLSEEIREEIRDHALWADLHTICMVTRWRQADGEEESLSASYYIGSRAGSAEAYAGYIREHWGIENSLHWVLDVQFGEDQSRIRKDHGAENLGLLRRLAVSLIKRDTSKGSVKIKQLRACLKREFLLELLGLEGED